MNNSEMLDEMAEVRIEKTDAAIRDAGEAIVCLGVGGIKAVSRIEKLEKQVARHAAEAIANLSIASVNQRNHIEKLEAALMDVTRCLIDGEVDMAAIMPGELHRHRILGAESVQTMVEVYHRLKSTSK